MTATEGTQPFTAARLRKYDPRVLENFVGPRLERDRGRFPEDMAVDMAHVVMLAEQDILTEQQAGAILAALREAERLGDAFELDPQFDAMLLQVERFVIRHAGADVGGRMHIGRSRIDRQAAIPRLHARNRLLTVHERLLALVGLEIELAREHAAVLMPGWTHLQHAQPWTFGHYLLRHAAVHERHLQRVEEAFARTNLSSLGAAALVGTSWPLDRHRVAELLGHDDIVRNSLDAGAFTIDWCNEVAALLSMIMVDLGRLAGDLILWHTWEFGLIELADEFCGSSSIMPQKKNPSTLEHIRSHAGHSIGWYASQASIGRSASSTDCDLPYAPFVVDDGATVTEGSLELMYGVLETLELKPERMERNAGAYWSTASGLADAMVRSHGLSFRRAHAVVARLVRNSIAEDIAPADVTPAHVDRAAGEVLDHGLEMDAAEITRELDPHAFLRSRVTVGSPNPAEMEDQVRRATETLEGHRAWQSARRAQVDGARRSLDEAVDRLLRAAGA